MFENWWWTPPTPSLKNVLKMWLSSIIRFKIEIRKLQEARLFDNYSHVRKNILVSEINIPVFWKILLQIYIFKSYLVRSHWWRNSFVHKKLWFKRLLSSDSAVRTRILTPLTSTQGTVLRHTFASLKNTGKLRSIYKNNLNVFIHFLFLNTKMFALLLKSNARGGRMTVPFVK